MLPVQRAVQAALPRLVAVVRERLLPEFLPGLPLELLLEFPLGQQRACRVQRFRLPVLQQGLARLALAARAGLQWPPVLVLMVLVQQHRLLPGWQLLRARLQGQLVLLAVVVQSRLGFLVRELQVQPFSGPQLQAQGQTPGQARVLAAQLESPLVRSALPGLPWVGYSGGPWAVLPVRGAD